MTLPPDIEAELDAALTPLRAEGLTAEQAAKRLPKHLRSVFWRQHVKRCQTDERAKSETEET
jgi:hypothetical protein